MIACINWRNLDDCHRGILIHNVDWSHCPSGLKRALIEEFNMSGYQPKASKTNVKTYWYDDFDAAVNKCGYLIGWIGYPVFIYLFLWSQLMANGLSIFMAIVAIVLCIIPAIIVSVLAGGIIGLAACCIGGSIHGIVLKKREKIEEKQKEFDKFIKGCRNGRN